MEIILFGGANVASGKIIKLSFWAGIKFYSVRINIILWQYHLLRRLKSLIIKLIWSTFGKPALLPLKDQTIVRWHLQLHNNNCVQYV